MEHPIVNSFGILVTTMSTLNDEVVLKLMKTHIDGFIKFMDTSVNLLSNDKHDEFVDVSEYFIKVF